MNVSDSMQPLSRLLIRLHLEVQCRERDGKRTGQPEHDKHDALAPTKCEVAHDRHAQDHHERKERSNECHAQRPRWTSERHARRVGGVKVKHSEWDAETDQNVEDWRGKAAAYENV